jgi:hypothetical protein
MPLVVIDQRNRILDHRPVRRIRPQRIERPEPIERAEVFGKAAAVRSRNHHRAAGDEHVADEQRARLGVPQGHVVRGVSRRVHHLQLALVGRHDRAVGQWCPRQFGITGRPGQLRQLRRWPAIEDGVRA